jgi:hypothetical protein
MNEREQAIRLALSMPPDHIGAARLSQELLAALANRPITHHAPEQIRISHVPCGRWQKLYPERQDNAKLAEADWPPSH